MKNLFSIKFSFVIFNIFNSLISSIYISRARRGRGIPCVFWFYTKQHQKSKINYIRHFVFDPNPQPPTSVCVCLKRLAFRHANCTKVFAIRKLQKTNTKLKCRVVGVTAAATKKWIIFFFHHCRRAVQLIAQQRVL